MLNATKADAYAQYLELPDQRQAQDFPRDVLQSTLQLSENAKVLLERFERTPEQAKTVAFYQASLETLFQPIDNIGRSVTGNSPVAIDTDKAGIFYLARLDNNQNLQEAIRRLPVDRGLSAKHVLPTVVALGEKHPAPSMLLLRLPNAYRTPADELMERKIKQMPSELQVMYHLSTMDNRIPEAKANTHTREALHQQEQQKTALSELSGRTGFNSFAGALVLHLANDKQALPQHSASLHCLVTTGLISLKKIEEIGQGEMGRAPFTDKELKFFKSAVTAFKQIDEMSASRPDLNTPERREMLAHKVVNRLRENPNLKILGNHVQNLAVPQPAPVAANQPVAPVNGLNM